MVTRQAATQLVRCAAGKAYAATIGLAIKGSGSRDPTATCSAAAQGSWTASQTSLLRLGWTVTNAPS